MNSTFPCNRFAEIVRPARIATCLIAFVIGAYSGSSVSASAQRPKVNTLVGEKIKVAAAQTQPCGADSCANRGDLSLTFPKGAQDIKMHFFTTADEPTDRADVYETGVREVSFAHFRQEGDPRNNAEGHPVVTVYYYNRSNRDRIVQLTGDYTLP